MAHCDPEMRAAWRKCLIEVMQELGLPIPDDLLDQQPKNEPGHGARGDPATGVHIL